MSFRFIRKIPFFVVVQIKIEKMKKGVDIKEMT